MIERTNNDVDVVYYYYYDSHPTEEDLMGESRPHAALVEYLKHVLEWLVRSVMGAAVRCEDYHFSLTGVCGVLTWRAFSCRMVHFCASMTMQVICGLPKVRLMPVELMLRPSETGYLPRNYALLALTPNS